MIGNDRKIVNTVIKTGSYSGIGLLALGFALELANTFIYIQPVILKTLAFSGILVLIFTPVSAMVSLSVYFAYNRQWRWAAAAAFVGVLIIATFILIR
jgi:hypothetical protein